MSSESHVRKRSTTKSTYPRHSISTSESSAPPTPNIRKDNMKHSMKRSSSESVRKSISDKRKSKSDTKINKESEIGRKSSLIKAPANLKESTIKVTAEIEDPELIQLQKGLSLEDNWRKQAENEYQELKYQFEEFSKQVEIDQANPKSKYDKDVEKQLCFNETMKNKISEAKTQLKELSQSLKDMRTCGKDCNIHSRDLCIDYNCISKNELSKEIKRFQRLEIDLKNSLDRLHWRMDCESKMYHNLVDQYQKLQTDLYYLKNLNENAGTSKALCSS